MDPITLRLSGELREELDDEAEERGFSSRSEYIRHLLRNRSGAGAATHANTDRSRTEYDAVLTEHSFEDVADLAARVDELEDRVADLEGQGGQAAHADRDDRDGRGDATADRDDQDVATDEPELADAHSTREPRGVDDEDTSPGPETAVEAGADDVEALLEDYRAFLADRPPKKARAKDAVIVALEALRAEGSLSTGDLKDVLDDAVGDEYDSKKSMWESYRRHLKDLPGFDDSSFGEWAYAGDDVVRDALADVY